MTAVYPTRLASRDSFDDEDLTDIDDVFIRDGKRDTKINDDGSVKRPLMAPRKKPKISVKLTNNTITYRSLFLSLCYGLIALGVLFALMLLCILTINIFPIPFSIMKNWFSIKPSISSINTTDILPCTSLATSVVWIRTLSKLTSEAPLRSVDVNNDGVDDVILGFSTGIDALDVPEYFCNLYFDGQVPCLGGVMAIDGKSGKTLWTHWTEHAIFSIDCNLDITNDNIRDCIVTGRGGILHAIDSINGKLIWELPVDELPSTLNDEKIILNVYDARYITDVDSDEISDVIVSHTMQLGKFRQSRIILLSGKTGTIIKSIEFSKKEQLFIAPQVMVSSDGDVNYLLASCAPDKSGGLYVISQRDFLYGNLDKMKTIQHGKGEGILLPLIFVDLTLDGIEDIISISLNNSTIRAYDGLTYQQLWNYTVSNSEIISIPIPGYYNDDKIPDIMIKHQIGPGFPLYYYSITTIINGKNGKSLFDEPIKDSANGQMSGIILSVDGFGNDWFLHWSSNCLGNNIVNEKYSFLQGQTLLSQSRANLCKLRFNSTLNMKLLAMSQHVGPPGQSLYSSDDWKKIEFNNSDKLRQYSNDNDDKNTVPLVAQRSPIIKNLQMDIGDPDQQNKQIIVDEGGDYYIPNKNDDKNSELYEPYSIGLSSIEKKINDNNNYQVNQDWNDNINNAWNNVPIDKYEMSYNDDTSHLETPQDETEFNTDNKYNFMNNKRKKRIRNLRKKRYDDNFDNKNIRQPPTGIILPSFNSDSDNKNNKKKIDLIFSTYWLPSSEVSLVLLQKDIDCIRIKEEKLNSNKLDIEKRENIIAECLAERGINYKHYKDEIDERENRRFSLGQMTIYRIKLQCVCPDDMLTGQTCKDISSKQSWSAHMGNTGNGYFRPNYNK